jgi:hypothetical protein
MERKRAAVFERETGDAPESLLGIIGKSELVEHAC